MKKLVPFIKEIPFDTNIAEINSISLEHDIHKKDDNLITGDFTISGDYKMTDTSVSLDTFEYDLPFNINIDKKYNIDKANIDINDFYYEVINNRLLSVNIELAIDNIEEEESMEKEEVREENLAEIHEEKPIVDKVPEVEAASEIDQEETEDRNIESVKSLFDGLEENEKYVVYKIHIVTENDTIESIANDYEVNSEQISAYNDLSEVKIGDKIIIPANEN